MYELLKARLDANKRDAEGTLDYAYLCGRLDELKLITVACYEKDLISKEQFQEIAAEIHRM